MQRSIPRNYQEPHMRWSTVNRSLHWAETSVYSSLLCDKMASKLQYLDHIEMSRSLRAGLHFTELRPSTHHFPWVNFYITPTCSKAVSKALFLHPPLWPFFSKLVALAFPPPSELTLFNFDCLCQSTIYTWCAQNDNRLRKSHFAERFKNRGNGKRFAVIFPHRPSKFAFMQGSSTSLCAHWMEKTSI